MAALLNIELSEQRTDSVSVAALLGPQSGGVPEGLTVLAPLFVVRWTPAMRKTVAGNSGPLPKLGTGVSSEATVRNNGRLIRMATIDTPALFGPWVPADERTETLVRQRIQLKAEPARRARNSATRRFSRRIDNALDLANSHIDESQDDDADALLARFAREYPIP